MSSNWGRPDGRTLPDDVVSSLTEWLEDRGWDSAWLDGYDGDGQTDDEALADPGDGAEPALQAMGEVPDEPPAAESSVVIDDGLLLGTGSDDTLDAVDGDDFLDGMDGDDALSGGAGDDFAIAGTGDDRLDGGAGDDLLIGGDGDDLLYGGDGDDDLGGDAGDDVLTGGGGADIFSFDLMTTLDAGMDIVTDFRRGEDLLWLIGDNAEWSALDSDGNWLLDDADDAVDVGGGGLTIDLTALRSGLAGPASVVFLGVTELDTSDLLLADL